MFKHILCPVDGSECSVEALTLAAKLATEQRAQLTICTVVDPAKAASMAFGDPPMTAACLTALDEEATQLVKDATARVHDVDVVEGVSLDGQTVDSIVTYASAHTCDLIVMGSHGRAGLSRALLGSVAEGVVRRAHVPVLIVRRAPVAATAGAHTIAAASG